MKLISGVKIVDLDQIKDERGKVMHMLKSSDKHFLGFGEIYFSTAWPGSIKAWHIHKKMTLNNVVISGNAKLVVYDIREQSKTYKLINEFFIGEDNYKLIQIPPGLANGYKAYGDKQCILANCSTHPHEKKEILYIDPNNNSIPYNWDLKNK
jgi:dTDP-4-dehydrorhamnose 3,5-epimerase